MMSKNYYWNLYFLFLTVSTVFSHEDYFYKVSSYDDSFLKTDIITLPNTRTRRVAPEPASSLSLNHTNIPIKNTTIQSVNKNNATKSIPNLSSTSVVINDTILGNNAVTYEPPVHEGGNNFTYNGKPQPVDGDFPSTINNETLKENNITKTKNDTHTYYNSTTINDDKVFDQYWVNLTTHPDANLHEMLSDSHRRAATLKLNFQFPFYGHLINSITIATGGFLYLGEYIHTWLAATQYIAPLMANFDLSTSNYSNIYYLCNDTAFSVTWHNVTLQDKPQVGGFTFQTTLYSNGNIVFVYKLLPIKIKDIDSTNHPVKIGLSDAYVMDKVIFFVRRKTIYEYHRVSFHEDEVLNNTVIILTALPTCLERKNCTSCIKKDVDLQCYWCDNRCSSGIDRNRPDWFKKDCEKLKLNPEDVCATEIPILPHKTVDDSNVETTVKSESDSSSSSSNTRLFFIALFVSLIIMSLAWTLYAYLNPHTRAGQLLIRYRPNQWGWRKGEARYTAATIHM